jgi:hypothetical protein
MSLPYDEALVLRESGWTPDAGQITAARPTGKYCSENGGRLP